MVPACRDEQMKSLVWKCLSKSMYLNSKLDPASNLSLQPNSSLQSVNIFDWRRIAKQFCFTYFTVPVTLSTFQSILQVFVYDCKDLPYVQPAWPRQGHLTSSPHIVIIVWMHGIKYCQFCEMRFWIPHLQYVDCWIHIGFDGSWFALKEICLIGHCHLYQFYQGGSGSQCFYLLFPEIKISRWPATQAVQASKEA